ncbi:hypothetical protein BHE74_00007700 [Ensete ventricosum]|nr:hypothetical protein BHE74_00007700 [Ensete ventricosum]
MLHSASCAHRAESARDRRLSRGRVQRRPRTPVAAAPACQRLRTNGRRHADRHVGRSRTLATVQAAATRWRPRRPQPHAADRAGRSRTGGDGDRRSKVFLK